MNKKSIFKIQSKYLNVTNNKKQLKAIKNLEHVYYERFHICSRHIKQNLF